MYSSNPNFIQNFIVGPYVNIQPTIVLQNLDHYNQSKLQNYETHPI